MAGKVELLTPSNGKVALVGEDTAVDVTVTVPAGTATLLNTASNIEAQVKTATNASGSAPIYSCRAWVNFNGPGTVAIRASGNVTSITDNGTGDYTVNFTNAMPDANYTAVGSCSTDNSSSVQVVSMFNSAVSNNNVAPSTTGFRISTRNTPGSGYDEVYINVSVFR